MSNNSLQHRVKYRHNSMLFPPRFNLSTVRILARSYYVVDTMLLICAVTTLRLGAQTQTVHEASQREQCATGVLDSGLGAGIEQPANANEQKKKEEEEKKQTAQCDVVVLRSGFALSLAPVPTSDEQKKRAQCEADVVKPAKPVDGRASDKIDDTTKTPDNIADATKAALACEWVDANGVDNVLGALHFLTTGPRSVSLRCVIHVLEKGDRYPADECLYSAAMGSPDYYDQLTTQGLPNFLEVLAKANTLKKKAPADEDSLFDSTETLIQKIYSTGQGKRNLLQINDSFARNNNYVAIRQLLEAYPRGGGDKSSYARDLESLRAAFEMNPSRLAKQVAAKITSTNN